MLATMEVQSSCGEDWLGGLSLDAVVQKATNLERALSSCKARAVAVGEREGGWGGEGVRGGEEERRGDRKTLSEPKPFVREPAGLHKSSTESSRPVEEESVALAWQHLTTYIVALEKEAQQYKQLLEITPNQSGSLPSTSHQLGSLPSTTHQPGNLPSTPHQLGNLLSIPHQLGSLPSTTHKPGSLPFTPHQLGNLPSTPHQYAKSPHIVGVMGHGSGEQTAVEEVVTVHHQTASCSQDMRHWDALFEGDSESRVLLLVFCYLNTAELCTASRVSRRWYTVSRYPLLWRTVTITETAIPPEVLSSMARWCTHTEKITLHGLMPAMASCDEDLQSYIGRTRGSLEAALSSLLAVCGSHTLTTLTITECNLMITERVLWLVSVHCPQLQEFCYSSDEFPPSAEALWSLANGCTHIQHLSLPPVVGSPHVDWFTDNCILTIAQGWPSLRSLCVGGKAITTKGLAAVAQSCPCLVELELVHGPDLNSSAMGELCQDGGLQSLTTLTLTFTPTSPKALQCLINHCPCLSAVHLHISLHTYFSDPSASPTTTTTNYERVIRKLRALQHHPRIGQVFHLHEHYTTTALDTVVADMDTNV